MPSFGLWVACPGPVASGQGKKGSPSGREHSPQENPWQPVPGTHMGIDSHLPPTPSPSPGRPSWWGGADGQLSLKNPSSSHGVDMGSEPAGLRGGLVSSGPWSSALGRLPRPAMLLHGRLQRASGCTVCVSPRLIISFCWAPRCQNRALFTAPVPNQSLIHTV